MSKDDSKLIDDVSAALSRIDPEGLISIGAPFDEYNYEARLIVKKFEETSVLSMNDFIGIFEHAFSKDIENFQTYNKAYNEVMKVLK